MPTLGRGFTGALKLLATLAMILPALLTSTPQSPAIAFTAEPVAATHQMAAKPGKARLTAASSPARGDEGPVMVVLDTSGSMAHSVSGVVKIDAARTAVLDLVDNLDSNREYGLLQFSGSSAPGPDGCSPGSIVTRLGTLNVATASADVRRMRPNGETPTASALRAAGALVRDRGYQRGTLVLVSDGDFNCGADPCPVASDLRAQGLDVTVNTVGFEVSANAEQSLRCIADATGGSYAPATDAAALQSAMQAASQPVLQMDVSMPQSMAPVVGTTVGRGSLVTATVRNVGHVAAKDVRATLGFAPGVQDGAITVSRPVQYLGNLGPGASTETSFLVRPQSTVTRSVSWTATATASSGLAAKVEGTVRIDTAINLAMLGPVLAGVDRIAVVGDCDSAGEGAPPFQDGTFGDANHCHRGQTYAKAIWGDAAQIIACSGAVTADLRSAQISNGREVAPQLAVLREAVLSAAPPKAVLLTLGGNDSAFVELVKRCALRLVCQIEAGSFPLDLRYGDMALARADSIAPSLKRAYDDIDRAVNDPAGVAARGGQIAHIIVLPYVQILPRSSNNVSLPSACQAGLSPSELDFLNLFLTRLNTAILSVVSQQQKDGRPFYYVGDIVDAFQPNHTICDGTESWANQETSLLTAGAETVFAGELRQQLLHPNANGYTAEARALTTWAANAKARPTVTATAAFDTDVIHTPNAWDRVLRTVNKPFQFITGVHQTITDALQGYEPNTQVIFFVESTPQVIGAATTDAEGNVDEYSPCHHLPPESTTSLREA
jgi:Mg-chelatase subunit ChlD